MTKEVKEYVIYKGDIRKPQFSIYPKPRIVAINVLVHTEINASANISAVANCDFVNNVSCLMLASDESSKIYK